MRPGEGFLRKKIKAVSDELLTCREIYNPNAFTIIWSRNLDRDLYILRSNIPIGEMFYTHKAGEFLFLPHGYYFGRGEGVPDGEPISVITNQGDAMFKGNKLPSAPVADFKRYF